MKKEIKNIPLLYPIPIVLVGAYVDGQPNYATIGDVAIMGINPALMVVSLHHNHYTTGAIERSRVFSINIPTADMMKVVDYCGIYSGRKVDKSKLFNNIEGKSGAPIIDECPVNMECEVIQDVQIEHRHIFIGKVLHTNISEQYLKESDDSIIADLTELNPLMYAMDNKYYSIGKKIGTGYHEGKE